MKRLNRFILCLVLLTTAAHISSAAPVYLLPDKNAVPVQLAENTASPGGPELIAPKNGQLIPLLSDGHKEFLHTPRDKRIRLFEDKNFRMSMQRLGHCPLTVSFTWKTISPNSSDFLLLIDETPDFNAPAVFKTQQTTMELGNFKAATAYYWKVIDEHANTSSAMASFTTEDETPRLMKVPGISNFRDIGGSIGRDGRRIRQGLIYRSAKFNSNASPVYETLEPESPETSRLLAEKKERLDRVAWLKNMVPGAKGNAMPASVSRQWTVFLPGAPFASLQICRDFLALTAIPADFKGAAPVQVTADDDCKIVFPMPTHEPMKYPAFLMQEFQAERDGIMQLGCSADWFWAIAVNGTVIWDTLKEGNQTNEHTPEAHPMAIPVKKGKNLLAAALLNGTASWTWVCGDLPKPVKATTLLQMTYRPERLRANAIGKRIVTYAPGKSLLSDNTFHYLTQALAIKSEIDLRGPIECFGMTQSPMAPHAKWFHYSSQWDDKMGSEAAKKAFRNVFAVFLNPENYPVDFHCSAGKDRTGAVAFILGGLLGMPEEKLFLEWEASGFLTADSGFTHEKRFNKLLNVFLQLPGNSLNDKIENYVLGLGFSLEQINAFRDFMLENKPPQIHQKKAE